MCVTTRGRHGPQATHSTSHRRERGLVLLLAGADTEAETDWSACTDSWPVSGKGTTRCLAFKLLVPFSSHKTQSHMWPRTSQSFLALPSQALCSSDGNRYLSTAAYCGTSISDRGKRGRSRLAGRGHERTQHYWESRP